MVPKRLPPDDPREWLNRAKSNLAHAKALSPEVFLEDLCFDTQQAAEKAVKAVIVRRGETFPFSHDLNKLTQLLEQNGLRVPKYVKEARELTRFAMLTPPVTLALKRLMLKRPGPRLRRDSARKP
jgi:HEPN domain-containing protein